MTTVPKVDPTTQITSATVHRLISRLIESELEARRSGSRSTKAYAVAQAKLEGFAEAMSIVYGWTPFVYENVANDAVSYAGSVFGELVPPHHKLYADIKAEACNEAQRSLFGRVLAP